MLHRVGCIGNDRDAEGASRQVICAERCKCRNRVRRDQSSGLRTDGDDEDGGAYKEGVEERSINTMLAVRSAPGGWVRTV